MSRSSSRAVDRVDVAITVALGLLFLLAWVGAGDWPLRTALSPRAAAGLGFVLCLVRLGVATRRHLAGTDDGAAADEVADDAADEYSAEQVFRNTDRRTWTVALAWILFFYVLLSVFGIFVAAPAFTILYLLAVARVRVFVALTYAAVLWVFLYATFIEFLRLPVPRGLFG